MADLRISGADTFTRAGWQLNMKLLDMATEEDIEVVQCALCGKAIRDDTSGVLFVELELGSYLDIRNWNAESRNAIFCSQDHAARWLDQPLPAIPTLDQQGIDYDDKWFGRIETAFIFIGTPLLFGLAGFGLFSLVRLIWGN